MKIKKIFFICIEEFKNIFFGLAISIFIYFVLFNAYNSYKSFDEISYQEKEVLNKIVQLKINNYKSNKTNLDFINKYRYSHITLNVYGNQKKLLYSYDIKKPNKDYRILDDISLLLKGFYKNDFSKKAHIFEFLILYDEKIFFPENFRNMSDQKAYGLAYSNYNNYIYYSKDIDLLCKKNNLSRYCFKYAQVCEYKIYKIKYEKNN